MYHIYHSRAFILASTTHGEANKVLTLYTDTHGLIRAAVQAIRRQDSKLRYALQDFTSASVDFVRGKEMWRVTSAIPGTQYPCTSSNISATRTRARVVGLCMRMANGEEANQRLFAMLEEFLGLLEAYAKDKNTAPDRFRLVEIVFVAELLHALGHMPLPDALRALLEEKEITEKANRTVDAINHAIRESGL